MRFWQIRKRDADLQREIRSDLELEEEEQRERGVSPEEARYAAQRAFGNTTLIKWEFPRLCRGGSSSLTFTGVHPRNSER